MDSHHSLLATQDMVTDMVADFTVDSAALEVLESTAAMPVMVSADMDLADMRDLAATRDSPVMRDSVVMKDLADMD